MVDGDVHAANSGSPQAINLAIFFDIHSAAISGSRPSPLAGVSIVVQFMNISIGQTRAFSAVARGGSFTAAGRQISLAQAAASTLVQQLEEALNVQLFRRGTEVPR